MGRLVEHLATGFTEVGLTLIAQPWTSVSAPDAWATLSPAAVLAWSITGDEAERMRHDGIPVVASVAGGDDPIARWVRGAREDAVAELLVERMVTAGRERLGYAAPADERMAETSHLRLQALERACAARGLAPPVRAQIPLDPAGAGALVESWFQADPAITGICAHDAVSAMAVLAGARRMGATVPDDLAVIGVNDSPAAALTSPALTMVEVDAVETTRYIVAVVRALLDGDALPAEPSSVASLRERESV